MRKFCICASLAVLALAAPASAQYFSTGSSSSFEPGRPGGNVWDIDEYRYDDLTGDGQLELSAGGELVWLHVFDTIPGLDTITHVNSAIGWPGIAVPNTALL